MRKSEVVVVLGTAHLGSTPGKQSPDGRLRECVYSRQIVSAVKARLEAYGCRVVVDYEPLEPKPEWAAARKKAGYGAEQAKELSFRVQRVNALCRQHGSDRCLYVSIHLNAAANGEWKKAGGWCAYTTPGKTGADRLAECLYDAAAANLAGYSAIVALARLQGEYTGRQTAIRTNMSDGDRDMEASFYVLKHTLCPAVLTENLFQDNRSDVDFLLSDEGRHAIERTHVEGIINYIESL